jgi:hypothetical protein
MATIRVTCPTCGKALEVGAEYDDKEVECGECFQVFVARKPGTRVKGIPSARGKAPAAKSGRKRDGDDDDDYEHDNRRDEYDDDDYEPPSRGRRSGGGGHSTELRPAGSVLVLGIVSILFLCVPFIGIPMAIVTMMGPAAANYPPGEALLVRIGKLLAQLSIGLLLVGAVVAYWVFRAG